MVVVVLRTLSALVFVLSALSIALPAGAQGERPNVQLDFPPDSYYVATPDQVIRTAVDRLTGFLVGAQNADQHAVRHFLEAEIAPRFDFTYMARWAAGPYLHRLGPMQQSALATKLRIMFLDALARHLGAMERPLPQVQVFPARPGRSLSDAVVHARVTGPGRPPLRLVFLAYWSPAGWKVYDAVANGASAAGFYRQYFTRALRRHGPDMLLR